MEEGLSVRSHYELKPARGFHGPLLVESESLFRNRLSFPSESEQLAWIKRFIESEVGQPLILTLFDWEEDQPQTDVYPTPLKEVAVLDGYPLWKACPSLIRSQLRSWLQGSYLSGIWMAIPRLRRAEELAAVTNSLEKILNELAGERILFDRFPKIGVRLDSPLALRHFSQFLSIDFFLLDLDRLACHLLGIRFEKSVLLNYLPLRAEESELLLHWIGSLPFAEKWIGCVSYVQKPWEKLLQFPFEAFFLRNPAITE
jgi:hypothetical protein